MARSPSSSTVLNNSRSVHKRIRVDRAAEKLFLVSSALPLLIAIFLLITLVARSLPIFSIATLKDLLLGEIWKPMQAQFGFMPFIAGTFWVTLVAMLLAVPPCLLCAIFLAEYAPPGLRSGAKPLLDILAAIPSVVYGVWGVVAIVPWIQNHVVPFFSRYFGNIPIFTTDNPTGFSLFAGSNVLAIMIAPFIISVVYEVLHTVPNGYREASLAVGATRWQTIKFAVVPQVVPGIAAGIVLGASRALGETIAVLMVVGNVPQIPHSLFDPAYPLPALIANNYGEMMSIPLYDAALMTASLLLLAIVLLFNITATLVLRRFVGRSAARKVN